jgi:hypothetical protein
MQGHFGLIMFTAGIKTKEMGMRKALGGQRGRHNCIISEGIRAT